MKPIRLGVVGYGTGGQHFHTPFIDAADGVELAGVVTRSPQRSQLVERDWPGVPIYQSLTELLSSGVDAVTITTPPHTRRELVLEALAAGVHVMADKPFAPSAEAGQELADAADAAGLVLNVFHNRRWDADIQTLAELVRTDKLGRLWRVHARMDYDDPATLEAGTTGGLLRDIGSHLVDQMLWLLGDVESVFAHLDVTELAQGPTDVGFVIALQHKSGVTSFVESSKVNYLEEREIRVYAERGSYLARGTDVQAQAIFSGVRPSHDPERWGYEDRSRWGIAHTSAGTEAVPSEQGRYHDLYTQFAEAIRSGDRGPVPAAEGVRTLRVLDAARKSAQLGYVVNLD